MTRSEQGRANPADRGALYPRPGRPRPASGRSEVATIKAYVEIARDGVPVARLVPVEPSTPGSRFLAAHGSLAGAISISEDFEFSEEEIDAMLDDPQ